MSFKVTVRPSGRSFTVEGDETVLASALRQGIGIAYGCKNGACGTCRGKLLEGQLVHGPHSTSALVGGGRGEGPGALLLLAPTVRCRDRGARADRLRRHTDQEDAGAHRAHRSRGTGRGHRVAAASGHRAAPVPGRAVPRIHPARWIAPSLFDRHAAPCRRAAAVPHPPHAGWACSPTTCSAPDRSPSRSATSCVSKGRWARSSCAKTIRDRSSWWPAEPGSPRSRRSRSMSSRRASTARIRARCFAPWCSTGAHVPGRICMPMSCHRAGRASSRTSATCRCCLKRAPRMRGPGARASYIAR